MQTNKKISPASPQIGTRSKALMALAAVSILWGTTWVAARQGVKYMPALELAAIRQLLAGCLFVSYFTSKRTPWPRGRQWSVILVLSLLNLFLTNGLTTLGVQYIPAGVASIIAAIYPLWLLLIGFLLSGTKIPLRAIIGLLLGFGGICVIFYEHLRELLNPGFRFGILISLAASISWAFGTLYTKERARQFNPYFSIALQMIISGTLLFFTSLALETQVPLNRIPLASWVAISYLALFGSVVAFLAYLYALQHLPTEQVSIYAYINPVVAVILGSTFFGESFSAFMGIGGMVALYGVYLVNQSFRNKERPIKT